MRVYQSLTLRSCSTVPSTSWVQRAKPARDVSAEVLLLSSELSEQHRLFVHKHKQVKAEPSDDAVLKNADIAEKQSLAEDHRNDRKRQPTTRWRVGNTGARVLRPLSAKRAKERTLSAGG